jgi:hypothetical protein
VLLQELSGTVELEPVDTRLGKYDLRTPKNALRHGERIEEAYDGLVFKHRLLVLIDQREADPASGRGRREGRSMQ